jgi:hypothetical protein
MSDGLRKAPATPKLSGPIFYLESSGADVFPSKMVMERLLHRFTRFCRRLFGGHPPGPAA